MKIKKTMHVRPLREVVRDPTSYKALPVDQVTEVPLNSYWVRRVNCGDVEEVKSSRARSTKPKKEKQED